MKFEIKSYRGNTVLFSAETETLRSAVEAGIKSGAYLYGADLSYADLGGANLHGADLRGADLHVSDLRGADLHFADLRGVNLSDAVIIPGWRMIKEA